MEPPKVLLVPCAACTERRYMRMAKAGQGLQAKRLPPIQTERRGLSNQCVDCISVSSDDVGHAPPPALEVAFDHPCAACTARRNKALLTEGKEDPADIRKRTPVVTKHKGRVFLLCMVCSSSKVQHTTNDPLVRCQGNCAEAFLYSQSVEGDGGRACPHEGCGVVFEESTLEAKEEYNLHGEDAQRDLSVQHYTWEKVTTTTVTTTRQTVFRVLKAECHSDFAKILRKTQYAVDRDTGAAQSKHIEDRDSDMLAEIRAVCARDHRLAEFSEPACVLYSWAIEQKKERAKLHTSVKGAVAVALVFACWAAWTAKMHECVCVRDKDAPHASTCELKTEMDKITDEDWFSLIQKETAPAKKSTWKAMRKDACKWHDNMEFERKGGLADRAEKKRKAAEISKAAKATSKAMEVNEADSWELARLSKIQRSSDAEDTSTDRMPDPEPESEPEPEYM